MSEHVAKMLNGYISLGQMIVSSLSVIPLIDI